MIDFEKLTAAMGDLDEETMIAILKDALVSGGFSNLFLRVGRKIVLDVEEYYLVVSNNDSLFVNVDFVIIHELQGLPVVCIQTLETWLHEFERYYDVKFRLRGKMHYMSMARGISNFKEYVLVGRPSEHFTEGQYAASNKRTLLIRDAPPRPFCVWYKPKNEKHALELQRLFPQTQHNSRHTPDVIPEEG